MITGIGADIPSGSSGVLHAGVGTHDMPIGGRPQQRSPASIIDSAPASQRLNTSRNFCILLSCSHVVRFIDLPPEEGGRKPDNSCAT
jgi:hypothetical protein